MNAPRPRYAAVQMNLQEIRHILALLEGTRKYGALEDELSKHRIWMEGK